MADVTQLLNYLAQQKRQPQSDYEFAPWMSEDYVPPQSRTDLAQNDIRARMQAALFEQDLQDQEAAPPPAPQELMGPQPFVGPQTPGGDINSEGGMNLLRDLLARNGVIKLQGDRVSEGTDRSFTASMTPTKYYESPEIARTRQLADIENEYAVKKAKLLDAFGIPGEERAAKRAGDLQNQKGRWDAKTEIIKQFASAAPAQQEALRKMFGDLDALDGGKASPEVDPTTPPPPPPGGGSDEGMGWGTGLALGAAALFGGPKAFRALKNRGAAAAAAKEALAKVGIKADPATVEKIVQQAEKEVAQVELQLEKSAPSLRTSSGRPRVKAPFTSEQANELIQNARASKSGASVLKWSDLAPPKGVVTPEVAPEVVTEAVAKARRDVLRPSIDRQRAAQYGYGVPRLEAPVPFTGPPLPPKPGPVIYGEDANDTMTMLRNLRRDTAAGRVVSGLDKVDPELGVTDRQLAPIMDNIAKNGLSPESLAELKALFAQTPAQSAAKVIPTETVAKAKKAFITEAELEKKATAEKIARMRRKAKNAEK